MIDYLKDLATNAAVVIIPDRAAMAEYLQKVLQQAYDAGFEDAKEIYSYDDSCRED